MNTITVAPEIDYRALLDSIAALKDRMDRLDSQRDCLESQRDCLEIQNAKLQQRVLELENQYDPSKVALLCGNTILQTSRDDICKGTPYGSMLHTAFNGRDDIPYKIVPTYNLGLDGPFSTVTNEIIVHYIRNNNIFLENVEIRHKLYDNWRCTRSCADVLGLTNLSSTITENVQRWIICDFIEEAERRTWLKIHLHDEEREEFSSDFKFEDTIGLPLDEFRGVMFNTSRFDICNVEIPALQRLLKRMDIEHGKFDIETFNIGEDTAFWSEARIAEHWHSTGKYVLNWFALRYCRK